MRSTISIGLLLLIGVGSTRANGLLIPEEKTVPPLAMVHHRVTIALEDQVAVTRLEQTFRNHTGRELEATYVFPVPKGASVNKFSMWVNGQEAKGELLDAPKARQIYEDIVRRTQDPGLLEYMGQGLFRVRVFPILPKADQKISLTYTSVAQRDQKLVEYIYPLKTDGKTISTLEDFSINATLKSQHAIQNVYSPTHAISITRNGDREVHVRFEKNQAMIDRDFQLFYGTGDKDVGFSTLTHRPISTEKGYVLLLVSPRVELPKDQIVPRDMVFVLDTSGSMRGAKMDQARRALKYCLDNLGSKDRFAVLNFSTTVGRYRDNLVDSNPEQIGHAKKWVDALEATGGTAIHDALSGALDLRTSDSTRTFTVVFFTDGLPTIGETNPERILGAVVARNSASTRIFTFGVGYDVNTNLLDQLADRSRAVSSYVRPEEDIEAKVSGLYSKISHPVLANLKLTTSGDFRLEEVYPPQLPDLFHGGQLVVLGRFTGKGTAKLVLTGGVGKEGREFVYDFNVPDRTGDDKSFVEHLWARRKVGYLLDQIRANGEKKELVEETVALAKKYGIATPYTSYLVVPDAPINVAGSQWSADGRGGAMAGEKAGAFRFLPLGPGSGLGAARKAGNAAGGFGGGIGGGGGPGTATNVADFAKQAQSRPGELPMNRVRAEEAKKDALRGIAANPNQSQTAAAQTKPLRESLTEMQKAEDKRKTYDEARRALALFQRGDAQTGKLGVDLAYESNALKNQACLTQTALRNVAGRNCLEVGGVWIDEKFQDKTPIFTLKAQSNAYFRLLTLQPEMKEVFKLGNALVWMTPSGTALVIDPGQGVEEAKDAELTKLFAKK